MGRNDPAYIAMDRRAFGRLAGGAALGAAAAEWSAAQAAPAPPTSARKRALMKVGTQHDSSDATLAVLAALGVNDICSTLPSTRLDEQWTVEGLTKLRERVESFGIRLDMVPLPLSSHPIARAENPNLMRGRSPERDREIDGICTMIRNSAQAGIPALKYNMSILGVVRTEPTRGRGGAQYSTFSYAKAGAAAATPTEAGPVPPDAYWERITYFLERKEVGYDGTMMPDHVPKIAGDPAGAQAFAYTFGYIKALIRAVDAEA